MISPRWRKVFRDLWSFKTRTLLVVISIAVGVAAVGMVASTYNIITRDLVSSYEQINPAHAKFITSPFTDDFVQVVRNIPQVKDAEGRFNIQARIQVGPDEWRDITLTVIPNFNNIQIDKITPEGGGWPPGERELLIERASLQLAEARAGEMVTIETGNGLRREMRVAGLAHDITKPSGVFSNQISGYISFTALEWLGFDRSYNELLVIFNGDRLTRPEVRQLSYIIEDKIKKSGRPVYATTIPEPGKHWFEPYLTPMSAILGVIGTLILFLSGFLAFNTITALLAQQTRQIGVMKAVGAQASQILFMYLFSMLVIGLFALALAVPSGWFGMRFAVNLLAGYINFNVYRYDTPLGVLQLQVILSLLVPLVASILPIAGAARVTVREAISDYGLTNSNFGRSLIDRLLSWVQGLPRPLMLSLRNTFRRKLRLILTLATLMLGSALFIAVMSVNASLVRTLNEALEYYAFDVGIFFVRPYRAEQVLSEVYRVPGVAVAETWGGSSARIINADGSESNNITVVAPPVDTQLIKPDLISGRWLLDGDDGAIVINTDVLKENPDIKVGEVVELKIDGEKSTWKVVGIVRSVMIGPWIYTTYPYLARVTGQFGQVSAVYIGAEQHDPATQLRVAKAVEDHFKQVGLRVSSTGKVYELRRTATQQFNVIFAFLMIMSIMLTIVGSLGLTGTMSLNVFERIREIGIMRAIGASDGAIMQIVLVEGLLIGLMGWIGGALLSLPISRLLSNVVGESFLRAPLAFSFSVNGAFLWLAIMIILAVVSSFLPARAATRTTVRDVLAYE